MQKASSYIAKVLLGLLLFLTFSCEKDYTVITSDKFELLLKAEVVNRVVIIKDKGMVEIYLDEIELTDAPFANEFKAGEVLAIKNIEEEYFLDKYDRLLRDEIEDAPLLEFETRPNFNDFLSTYGFLLILILGFLAVCIALPIVIVSQKKKIKKLEAQVRMLHDQKSSSDQK